MSRWQDGGPLDPPEVREVDFDAVLASRACPECDAPGPWYEAIADGVPLWACACGYSYTDAEVYEMLEDLSAGGERERDEADRDERARDRYWQGRLDEARGK
jgi:rubredoxin